MAPVSIIHLKVLYVCLSTMWAGKIECAKERGDQKGLLEKLLTKVGLGSRRAHHKSCLMSENILVILRSEERKQLFTLSL